MRQNVQQFTFLGLVLAVFGGRVLASDSLGVAIGSAVIEIPAAIALGRIALWFADKLVLFARNAAHPESPKNDFARTIWQTLSLSLAIGFPLWLLASQA